MEQIIPAPDFLLELAQHPVLNLAWPVEVCVVEDDDIGIMSDADEQWHRIYADPQRMEHWQGYRPAWVHELAHATLAEKIDPVFSCVLLAEGHGSEPHQLQEQEEGLFLNCWQLVDIWVDDLMVQVDPRLKTHDLTLFSSALSHFAQVQDYDRLTEYRTIMGIAMALAECDRHGIDPAPFERYANLYPEKSESDRIIREMSELYRSLGTLSNDPEQSITALEDAVQRAACIVRLKRHPRIITENGKKVWLLEVKSST